MDEVKDIAIFGAGGFGKEVACLIRSINDSLPSPQWNLIGFFDDNPLLEGKAISHFGTCLGGKVQLNQYPEDLSLVLAVGNPKVAKSIFEAIHNEHISYPNLLHPKFAMADPESFSIGRGNIIQANCTASCDVTIGDFNVFNSAVTLGHDVSVGNHNAFMPATRLSGEVTVGEENFFGVGSIVLQQIKVGNNVRLGAGSVLMTKPKDGNLYMGNPAMAQKF